MSNNIPRARRLPDGAIDQAIDRAVRTMTAVEPPAGLRRRVIARLEAPAPRAGLLPRFTMAAATLAAIALAVFLLRPSPAPVPVQRAVSVPPPSVQTPDTTPAPRPQSPEAQTAAAEVPRRAVTDTRIPMPRIANVFGTIDARVVATGAPIDDVVFPESPTGAAREDVPGMPRPIGITEIRVPPLQIELIRVEPMPTRKQAADEGHG